MNCLNQLILEGTCVKDVEFRDVPIPNAKAVIAVERSYKSEDGAEIKEVSYFDIESFGQLAEVISKHGKKGRGIRVVGRLKQNRWTDETSKTHSRVSVVAEYVEFKPTKEEK